VRRLLSVAAAALLVALTLAAPAVAASPTFERPTATATFGTDIVFRQAFSSPLALLRVELLLEFPESDGPFVVEVAGATAAGDQELVHRWSITDDGHLVPNTAITARWRLVPADRATTPLLGPVVRIVYADTRFTWRTLEGNLVRLHWYDGADSFGRRALEIGERAVREASDFLGVNESEPIDFFVYGAEDAFRGALGPGTRENVGGQAHADIRTMFALIEPGEVADPWVGVVIPHELTHLVFDSAVRNPYHFPPRWLNEGVATYLSEGFTASDRASVRAAGADGRLMPLRALGGQFPTTAERFYLAYAESVSAVDYLVREKGTASLVKLIRSYAGGVTDDEAFTAAVGTDLAGFEDAWLADVDADAPTRHGPQPAPAGPLPPGWGSDATPAPPAGSPGPSATPGGSPGSGPGGPANDGDSPLRDGWVLLVAALGGLLVGGGLAYVRRRRRARASAGEEEAAHGTDGTDGAPP